MSDMFAGPPSDAGDDGWSPWGGGSPPTVVLAALGAVAFMIVLLIAFLVGKGAGSSASEEPINGGAGAAAPDSDGRVVLKAVIEGDGGGRVQIIPPGVTCEQSCEREYPSGTRLNIQAVPDNGSFFAEWGVACAGTDRCSVYMNRTRTLRATFRLKPLGIDPACEDGQVERNGECIFDGGATPAAPRSPASDCDDGKDNDGDGLIDRAQDPGCEANSSEVGADVPLDVGAPPAPGGATTTPETTTTPRETTTTPRRKAPLNDCNDGKDNDGDGLTDAAQDPNCTDGNSEG